jgi:polyphosphate kinase 2
MSEYKQQLRALQIQLVRLQRHIIGSGLRVLVLFEGRDSSGKDGIIKRITQHLSPRDTRVVALGPPSNADQRSWYFQRYVAHLPRDGEMVLMNRSWYNRAGVERVMGFCTDVEHERFMRTVLPFERMLVGSNTLLLKYYLDISREEQEARLGDRRIDPLKQWKVSPIDDVAVERWDDYSNARNDMLMRTHAKDIPWWVVRTDDKRIARLNVIRHMLSRLPCPDIDVEHARADPRVVFAFEPEHLPPEVRNNHNGNGSAVPNEALPSLTP